MSKALRVAVVAACPFPFERGTPIRIRRLAEGLAAHGHEVDVATYHIGDQVELPGVRIHRTTPVLGYTSSAPGPNLGKLMVIDPLLVVRLRWLLSQRAFDIIHAHHVEGLIVALLARGLNRRLPIVFDAHTEVGSELPYYAPAATSPLMRAIGRGLDRWLPPRADHTVTVTPGLRTRLLAVSSLDPERVTVVSNGLEFPLFEEARRRAPTECRGRTIVFTGNLAAYQGIDLMLTAFARVRQQLSEARLTIVSHETFAPFEEMARALGIRDALEIAQVGFAAVPDYLARADVALNPRLDAPGIPQKTLNYMAMGLPIVSFAGSGRHLVDGETALLVEDGDIEGFANAIVRVLEDPSLAHRIGSCAERLVRDKNDWHASSRVLERVLERVVACAAERR